MVEKIIDERLKESNGSYSSYLHNFTKKYEEKRQSMIREKETS